MGRDRKNKRKRIPYDVTGNQGYGNRGGKGGFHPAAEGNLDGSDPDGDIDYEELEDRWYEIEDDYRERYPELTDEDVNVEPARFDRTVHRIGRRTDRSPEEVRNEIRNW